MSAATVIDPKADVVLQIRGLTLPGQTTIQSLDLVVRKGETVALLGDDQVELTEIIRVVGGLSRPAGGSVNLLGIDVVKADREALLRLRRRVGYVSIAGGLLSNMSVRANIELALRYHARGNAAYVRKQTDALLEEAGLTSLAREPASVIPAEYQKCAAYVRALACEPEVLLVEDPAAFLHPEGRFVIERVHARLRTTQTTVLLADDDVDLASRLVQRAIWLTDGTITHDGPFEALQRPTTVRTEIP